MALTKVRGNGVQGMSLLSTSTALTLDANGHITKPLQSSFLVQATASSNLALNTTHTVAFGTEVFDQNGDFTSNTFTAPVTGKYQFNVSIRLDSLDDVTQYYVVQFSASNRTIQSIHGNSGYDADVNYMNFNLAALIDMDANDTCVVKIDIPSLGTAQADLNVASRFSGYLVA